MNLNDLKYESLSFAEELIRMGNTAENTGDMALKMQVIRTGDTISSLYLNEEKDYTEVLKTEEKAINEAMYWIYMLYSAHAISMTVYKSLERSANNLLDQVSNMLAPRKKDI